VLNHHQQEEEEEEEEEEEVGWLLCGQTVPAM